MRPRTCRWRFSVSPPLSQTLQVRGLTHDGTRHLHPGIGLQSFGRGNHLARSGLVDWVNALAAHRMGLAHCPKKLESSMAANKRGCSRGSEHRRVSQGERKRLGRRAWPTRAACGHTDGLRTQEAIETAFRQGKNPCRGAGAPKTATQVIGQPGGQRRTSRPRIRPLARAGPKSASELPGIVSNDSSQPLSREPSFAMVCRTCDRRWLSRRRSLPGVNRQRSEHRESKPSAGLVLLGGGCSFVVNRLTER